jgi:hypothetical protein
METLVANMVEERRRDKRLKVGDGKAMNWEYLQGLSDDNKAAAIKAQVAQDRLHRRPMDKRQSKSAAIEIRRQRDANVYWTMTAAKRCRVLEKSNWKSKRLPIDNITMKSMRQNGQCGLMIGDRLMLHSKSFEDGVIFRQRHRIDMYMDNAYLVGRNKTMMQTGLEVITQKIVNGILEKQKEKMNEGEQNVVVDKLIIEGVVIRNISKRLEMSIRFKKLQELLCDEVELMLGRTGDSDISKISVHTFCGTGRHMSKYEPYFFDLSYFPFCEEKLSEKKQFIEEGKCFENYNALPLCYRNEYVDYLNVSHVNEDLDFLNEKEWPCDDRR